MIFIVRVVRSTTYNINATKDLKVRFFVHTFRLSATVLQSVTQIIIFNVAKITGVITNVGLSRSLPGFEEYCLSWARNNEVVKTVQ